MTGTIIVTGTGTCYAEADRVSVEGRISIRRPGHAEAISASVEALSALNQALMSRGFSDGVLKTTSMSVSPVYAPADDRGRGSVLEGYEATQGYSMEFPIDSDALSRALDAMEAAGPSRFTVSYTVGNGSEHMAEARRLAVRDAVSKAEAIADATGVRLGGILRIDYANSERRPVMFARAAVANVDAESQEFSDSVTIEWELA